MAGLRAVAPEIEGLGAGIVVIGNAEPAAIPDFREATGWRGRLLVDPSLRTYRAAGLVHGMASTFHPRSVLKGIKAFTEGFRQGAARGRPLQQGGMFVIGPGEIVRFEWRDRFAGDHPNLTDVVATLRA